MAKLKLGPQFGGTIDPVTGARKVTRGGTAREMREFEKKLNIARGRGFRGGGSGEGISGGGDGGAAARAAAVLKAAELARQFEARRLAQEAESKRLQDIEDKERRRQIQAATAAAVSSPNFDLIERGRVAGLIIDQRKRKAQRRSPEAERRFIAAGGFTTLVLEDFRLSGLAEKQRVTRTESERLGRSLSVQEVRRFTQRGRSGVEPTPEVKVKVVPPQVLATPDVLPSLITSDEPVVIEESLFKTDVPFDLPDVPRRETIITTPPKLPPQFTTSSETGKRFGFFTETELGRDIRELGRTGGEVVSEIISLGGLLDRQPSERGSAFVPIPTSIDLEQSFRGPRETGTSTFKPPSETGDTTPEQKFEVVNLKVQTQLGIDTNKLQDNLVNKFQTMVDSGALSVEQANTQLTNEFDDKQRTLTTKAQTKLDTANRDLQRGVLAASTVPSFLEGLVFGGISVAAPPVGAALFVGSLGGLAADFPDVVAQARTFPREFALSTGAGLLGAGIGAGGVSRGLKGIKGEPGFIDLKIKTPKLTKKIRLKSDKDLLFDIETKIDSQKITSAATSKFKKDLLKESIKKLDELELTAPGLAVLELGGEKVVSLKRPRATKARIRKVSDRLRATLKKTMQDDELRILEILKKPGLDQLDSARSLESLTRAFADKPLASTRSKFRVTRVEERPLKLIDLERAIQVETFRGSARKVRDRLLEEQKKIRKREDERLKVTSIGGEPIIVLEPLKESNVNRFRKLSVLLEKERPKEAPRTIKFQDEFREASSGKALLLKESAIPKQELIFLSKPIQTSRKKQSSQLVSKSLFVELEQLNIKKERKKTQALANINLFAEKEAKAFDRRRAFIKKAASKTRKVSLSAIAFGEVGLTKFGFLDASRSGTKIKLKPITIKPPKKKIRPTFDPRRKRKEKKGSFAVDIRRFGKFFEVAKELPRGRALKRGVDVTEQTLAATFRIRKTGKRTRLRDINFEVPIDRFRRPTKRSKPFGQRAFIQRARGPGGARLGSRGERFEIQEARKSKRRRRRLFS